MVVLILILALDVLVSILLLPQSGPLRIAFETLHVNALGQLIEVKWHQRLAHRHALPLVLKISLRMLS